MSLAADKPLPAAGAPLPAPPRPPRGAEGHPEVGSVNAFAPRAAAPSSPCRAAGAHALPAPEAGKSGFYWDTESLIVVGLFTALGKAASRLVALLGGGMNPVTLLLKNGVATALLVVMVARVRKFGALALYTLVAQVISFLMTGGIMIGLLPLYLLGALVADALIALFGGYRRLGAVLVGVAVYDAFGRVFGIVMSVLAARENVGMVGVGALFVAFGYLGCLAVGLPCGATFVKELRHAGIIREL